ncbi:hypothetical protein HK101_009473 [Irineochytrium annulatum]|nr:hypothetical protein HK101_009473 [Irineochytrium annulatum]
MNVTTPGNHLDSEPNSLFSDANRGAVDTLEVLYKGQPLSWNSDFMDDQNVQFPDQFDLSVNVTLKGYDVPFQFVLPVTKTTPVTVLTSKETKHHDNINLQISKLEIPPITTQLFVEYKTNPGQSIEKMLASIPSEYKGANGGIIALQYDIVDEHGVQLKPIGSHPISESYNIRFEPFKTLPRTSYPKVKPQLGL